MSPLRSLPGSRASEAKMRMKVRKLEVRKRIKRKDAAICHLRQSRSPNGRPGNSRVKAIQSAWRIRRKETRRPYEAVPQIMWCLHHRFVHPESCQGHPTFLSCVFRYHIARTYVGNDLLGRIVVDILKCIFLVYTDFTLR